MIIGNRLQEIRKSVNKKSKMSLRYMLVLAPKHLQYTVAGLDIGYVPAGSHAFLRLSGQFGPPQFIFHWPEGPVFFFFFFFFLVLRMPPLFLL